MGPVRGMFRQLCRTDDVADLWESTSCGILVELLQSDVGHAFVGESGTILRLLVLLEPR